MSVNVVNKYTGALTKVAGNAITEASGINYSHTTSGMSATNVQDAIDESYGSLKSGLTTLDNEVNGDAVEYPYADVITIEDAIPANVADCTVKIEPVQDLHGYDKPWVGGAGDNQFNTDTASGTATNKGISASVSNNVISFSLTGSGGRPIFSLSDLGIADVTLSAGTWRMKVFGTTAFEPRLTTSGLAKYLTDKTALTLDSDFTFTHMISTPDLDGITLNESVQIVVYKDGETVNSYSPYTNICPITGHTEASVEVTDGYETTKTYTIALGDTIYGGTVDFNTGVMTVDRAYFKVTSIDQIARNSTYPTDQYKVTGITEFVADASKKPIADRYATGSGSGTINFAGSTTKVIRITTFSTYESLQDAYAEIEGTEICYYVEPTTIQLTPQQIQLLQGQNTLTASTGQISVTVNGVSGSIGAVQTQANATDEALAELAAGIAEQLPTAPTTDGAYVLTVTVADGTSTYSWESAT